MKASNPLAFRPRPVIVITSVVYIVFAAALLYVGCTVPSASKSDVPVKGVNLSEAFSDLQTITKSFHPYNSRSNVDLRDWLLARTDEILNANEVEHVTLSNPKDRPPKVRIEPGTAAAVKFNDWSSNVSFSAERLGAPAVSTYFEGTNVIVYLRGQEDPAGAWWATDRPFSGQNGVLVNAHYDSVSTGYGATDDGVGVVTVLQLLKYFSTKGNQPKHGIIFLLNNGEEDFLNGARAFAQHPASKFPDRFLNLEGAGAGGRAALFRSTDTEVTRFYEGAKHPFASSTSDDGFKAGLVKSETDYRVFYGDMGMRGLDVAFLEPRSKYHTTEDDSRHTSRDSLWHMLSAALPTMKKLVEHKLDDDSRTEAAWFDLFGRDFAVMELHTLFALQVTLLVIAPLSIFLLLVLLQRNDKLYLFSRYKYLGSGKARMGGLKGLFRAPLIFAISSAITVAIAFLIMKFNPFIISSSPWSVWACFTSIWIFATWFQSRFADYVRPTALHRVYSLAWLHLGSWVLGVAAAVYEDRGRSSGYIILFYELGFWLATLLALSEIFVLTRKSTFAAEQLDVQETSAALDAGEAEGEETEPTEQTALLREQDTRTSFRPRSRRTENASTISYLDDKPANVYAYEQYWSAKIPSSLWVLEFLLASVPAFVFIGPIMTFVTSALTQTLSDGGALNIYIPIAALSILFVAPVQPFVHRLTYHIPGFLLLVFAGTLIYNLIAFPFSSNNRLKLYFAQNLDVDTGLNTVILSGADDHLLERAVFSLPSATGKSLNYTPSARAGLIDARWHGLPPLVVDSGNSSSSSLRKDYKSWVNVTISTSKHSEKGKGTITVDGRDTLNCKLVFDIPVRSFYVDGSAINNGPFPGVPEAGTNEIRLWRREYAKPWTVQLTWDDQKKLEGRAICLWNTDFKRESGGIPALEEVWHYAPTWVAVTKAGDGLVEASKHFTI